MPALQADRHRSAQWAERISAVIEECLPNTVNDIAVATAEMSQVEANINEARTRLANSYARKFGEKANTYSSGPIPAPGTWLIAASTLAIEVESTRVPLTKERRKAHKAKFAGRTSTILGQFEQAIQSNTATFYGRLGAINRTAHAEMTGRLPRAVLLETNRLKSAHGLAVHQLPGIAPVWPTSLLTSGIGVGVGELIMAIGTVRAVTVNGATCYTLPSAQSKEVSSEFQVPLPAGLIRIPLLIDIDKLGGLVVDDAAVISNIVLDLLAVLPAGRVRVDAVDPVKLGKSLDYLYGLGDSGAKVFGNKVRTTAAEAAALLVELEAHVAFVTQKYLQGQYSSLSEYNQAAGEVAEPYRLVLLYEYPLGFTRDGTTFDDESLLRLQKLTKVGRRAGVFIFATTTAMNNVGILRDLPTWFVTGTNRESVAMLGLPLGGPETAHVRQLGVNWQFEPYAAIDNRVAGLLLAHIECGLNTAQDVRVDPTQVSGLAKRAMALDVARGTRSHEGIADPDDSRTWWAGEAFDEVVSRFGRSGAVDVAALRLSSGSNSALVGGRTGSGKSVLLHSIILGLALQYRPEDLELYLIDLKEGVEFKQYATMGLPHARVVAIETNREFGISVLESLDAELTRRGELFRRTGGQQVGLGEYRRATGENLPRILLMIDEFHKLFDNEDAQARRAAELIDRIVRQGRSFGIHTLLASQSIDGGAQLVKIALRQIATRLVLASDEADSRMLLADNNADAVMLSKPGEGILNTKSGLREANERFQASYWEPDRRMQALFELRAKADQKGYTRRPVVFEGSAPALVDDVDFDFFRQSDPRGSLALPLGTPISLAGPIAGLIRRVPGGNALLVLENGDSLLRLSIAALLNAGADVDVIDFDVAPSSESGRFDCFNTAGLRQHHRRGLTEVLTELLELVAERVELSDFRSTARILVLSGVHRARELDPNPDPYGEESITLSLKKLLRDGPEVGVHVIAWADRPAALNRRMGPEMVKEFSLLIIGHMGAQECAQLTGSELASSINPSQVVVDDFDMATTVVARRFAPATDDWLRALATRPGSDR